MKRLRYDRSGGPQEVARTLRLPVARTVPLAEAIPALTELERDQRPKGGELVITMAGN